MQQQVDAMIVGPSSVLIVFPSGMLAHSFECLGREQQQVDAMIVGPSSILILFPLRHAGTLIRLPGTSAAAE